MNTDKKAIYIGQSKFRINKSADIDASTKRLAELVMVITTTDASQMNSGERTIFSRWFDMGAPEADTIVELLNRLGRKLAHNIPVKAELKELIYYCGATTSRQWTVHGHYLTFIATRALEAVIPIRLHEFIDVIWHLWEDFKREMEQSSWYDTSRKKLITSTSVLLDWTSRVNAAKAYLLLINCLMHPWPEIRNAAAWQLRRWWSPTLSDKLCEALLMGIDDPNAQNNCYFILLRLSRLGDPTALPILRSLIDTRFDSEDTKLEGKPCNILRIAIRSCEKTAKAEDISAHANN